MPATVSGSRWDELTKGPGDGSRVHMWDCYDGLTQQQWVVKNGQIRLRDFGESLAHLEEN